jgi:hypothetical protein
MFDLDMSVNVVELETSPCCPASTAFHPATLLDSRVAAGGDQGRLPQQLNAT